MVVARFGSILPIVLFGTSGYDNHLNLFEEYWILFALIPIVVFMQCWFAVRLVYRAGKWIFISFLFCILTAFTLQLTTTVNQEKFNRAYHQRFESDYKFIDQEIHYAVRAYGVEFNTKTIEVLKQRFTDSSVEQVMSVKLAFRNDNPVSMDTIILQKIIIRNFKHGGWYDYRMHSIDNWHYALPKDILKQIYLFDINSNQTKELFEILKEQINLVNTPEIAREDYEKYTETERRRRSGARYGIPEPLINQLKEVRRTLLADTQYADFTKELPAIKDR